MDGFDPYDDEVEDWREDMEDLGAAFQEQLKAKGITRRLRKPKPKPIDPQERMRRITTASDALEKLLDDVEQEQEQKEHEFVECSRCRGEGGWMVLMGNPSNGPEWEECGECRGTGEIPRAEPSGRQPFRFRSF